MSCQAPAGKARVELLYESQTLWLDQKRIAALFGVEVHTINYRLNEIYATGELAPVTSLRKIRRVQIEGKRRISREISFYNLIVLISVGYRVNSSQATLLCKKLPGAQSVPTALAIGLNANSQQSASATARQQVRLAPRLAAAVESPTDTVRSIEFDATLPMRFFARRYDSGEVVEISLAGERIADIRAAGKDHGLGQVPWVAPAFFDLQINGYGGREFCSPQLTVEEVARIVAAQDRFGVVWMLPTVTTGGIDELSHGLKTIAAARRQMPELARRIPGMHLEGPYFSTEDGPRGAHPLQHCHPPDWDEFQRLQHAADGLIRLITMSPEYPQSPEFIRRAVRSGVVVAIGHTSASGEQIRAAVDAGAALSTHLGNGAHRLLPRHPNYLWDQLGEDRLQATLIADGHHLSAEVLRSMVRAKTPQRCIIISDLSGMAGLPPGIHHGQLCDVEICADGRLLLAGQDATSGVKLLAGASRPMGDGIGNMVRLAGVDLKTAVDMATLHPCKLLGLPPLELAAGQGADLVLFDLDPRAPPDVPAFQMRATILGGIWLEVT